MKFINYTNDGRVVVQHAALILSKLDETDTLELHTMDNAIILLKKDMTLVETRDVLQGMVRLARSMTLDALCNSDAEDKTPLVDESVDDEYEDTICRDAPPPGYQGYRMALSDVVELYDDSGSEFYYCDRVGFQPIRFEQKQDPCINMTL